ncbi:alpha/beta hydrolase [Pseudarthrobacter sp. J64]|uniref:alpha/beta hydrolase n=1 Tax=Pseudarthrobacter sp. J64 TaxID=3116485 RepID=UPI002E80CD25|nr:alpha/beta hydrolase [Pseudarthrobacter sp. J64]MEE2570085.1 alpha/beta hydrolase [Pseudarthrobacter sp. J64]
MGTLHRTTDFTATRPKFRSLARLGVGGAIAAAGAAALRSPWPAALAIRAVFAQGARKTVAEMEPFAPADGVIEHLGIPYLSHRRDEAGNRIPGRFGRPPVMDIFLPERSGPGDAGESRLLPAVVWIHGGAWLSGSSTDVAPYLRMLAAQGYAAVGLNYSIAPGSRYPTAAAQLNSALAYLTSHAGEYGLDAGRLVLAGDSAGAQLASQLAAMATNPTYARQVGITPGIDGHQLRGVLLHCGVYDLEALSRATGIVGWGFKTALWAYAGKKDWSGTPAARDMSTVNHITADFPAAFISGGNGDGLTKEQSQPLARKLRALGVPVTELFWEDGHVPALPHEYQFHLQYAEAHQALEDSLAFLKSVTGQAARVTGMG